MILHAEQVLISELNKYLRASLRKKGVETGPEPELVPALQEETPATLNHVENQEKEIIRLLLNYGNKPIHFPDEAAPESFVEVAIAHFILGELLEDQIEIENALYQRIFKEFAAMANDEIMPDEYYFIKHPEQDVCSAAIDFLTSPYVLSHNWESMHKISVRREESILKDAVISAVYSLKQKHVMKMLKEISQKLKECEPGEESDELIKKHMRLHQVIRTISEIRGTVIIN